MTKIGVKVGRLQKKKTTKSKKKSSNAAIKKRLDPNKKVAALKPRVASVKTEKKQKNTNGRKQVSTAKNIPAVQKTNIFQKAVQFLREVKIELKKVTWPGRKQTIGSTVVVLILVTIIAFFLGGVDIGLSFLVKMILQ